MGVSAAERKQWLSFSNSGLRLLTAIEALATEGGWTEPISRAELGRCAGILHRETLANALQEVGALVVVTRISARRACYGLRSNTVQPVNVTPPERSTSERSAFIEGAAENVHPLNVTEETVQPVNGNAPGDIPERSASERYTPEDAGMDNVQPVNDNPETVQPVNTTPPERSVSERSGPEGRKDSKYTDLSSPEEREFNPSGELAALAEAPTPIDYEPEDSALGHWQRKRTRFLLTAAGFDPDNLDPAHSVDWHRQAAIFRLLRRAAGETGLSADRAAELALLKPVLLLERDYDYWRYQVETGIKFKNSKTGRMEPPGLEWLIGQIQDERYGINHGYAPNWRWPGVALCPECGAEHRNGEGFLCDNCTADPGAETEEDLQAVQVDLTPVPEDWWAESLHEKVGTLEVGDGWLAALGQLETQLGKTTFNTWFGSCTALYYETSSGTLAVGVPGHKLQALERRAKSQLERALQAVLGAVIKVRLEANEEVAA